MQLVHQENDIISNRAENHMGILERYCDQCFEGVVFQLVLALRGGWFTHDIWKLFGSLYIGLEQWICMVVLGLIAGGITCVLVAFMV